MFQKGVEWWLCVPGKSKQAKIVVFQIASEVLKRRLNIFGNFRERSEVFWKSSEIFGWDWDVFGNPCIDKAKIARIWLWKSW